MYKIEGQLQLDMDMVKLKCRLEGVAEDKRQLLLLMVMFYDKKIEKLGTLIKQNMGMSDVISTPLIINCRNIVV